MTATGEKTAGLRKTNLITPSKSKYIMSVWTSELSHFMGCQHL